MVWQPPGHIPGFHFPGTNIPGDWIAEQERRRAQQAPPPSVSPEVARAREQVEQEKRLREEAERRAQREAVAAQQRARAAEVLPQWVGLISQILALPRAQSVTYTVSGDWSTLSPGLLRRRRPTRVDDPAGIGTHVRDRLVRHRAGWASVSTYTGLWPALAWLIGVTAVPGRVDLHVGSLWFNRDGAVVAGDKVADAEHLGPRSATPSLEFFWREPTSPRRTVRAMLYPSNSLFGPVSVSDLGPDHVALIESKAQGEPILLREPLAAITSMRKPAPLELRFGSKTG